MMQLFKKKDGFTLIELLIVILTGTIVTAAATTILLLAFRINRKSLDTVERQSVLRIMMSVVEDMGSDGEYIFLNNAEENEKGELKPVEGLDSWAISKENSAGSAGNAVISYDSVNDVIKTGSDAVLVENVTESLLYKPYTPFSYVRDVYTFSVTIQGKRYESTVYSRTQEEDWRADDPNVDFEDGRNAIVDIAASQISSTGYILENGDRLGGYYTLWYIDSDQFTDKWTKETPWCSTFASWVIDQTAQRGSKFDADNKKIYYLDSIPREASVNYLWLRCYIQTDMDHLKVNDYTPETLHINTPDPGDLIFFESKYEDLEELENLASLKDLTTFEKDVLREAITWEKEGWYININDWQDPDISVSRIISKPAWELMGSPTEYEPFSVLYHLLLCIGDGLDHVGIVAKVTENYVYTIEGNTSLTNDTTPMVAVRRYALNDENIFGYATLNWNPAYK